MTTYSKYFMLITYLDGVESIRDDYESLNDALSNAYDQGYDQWEIWDDDDQPVASNYPVVKGNEFKNHWKVWHLYHWMELVDPETRKSIHGKAYFKDGADMLRFLETFDNTYDKLIGWDG